MTPSDWHAPGAVLERFAREPGSLDPATAGSVEAHLVACAVCRAAVAREADPDLAATSWASIADRIDRPERSPLEWVLVHLGVRSGPARLASATPGLRLSGVAALVGVTVFAVFAASKAESSGPFLMLAPLVPLLAVALSFAAGVEPSGETGMATPMHGAGLLLRRAIAVLVLAFLVLGVGSLFLADGAAALRWIVPTAAVALVTLALGTWVRIEIALISVATTWVVAVCLLRWFEPPRLEYTDLAPFTAPGQWVALGLAVVAAAVLASRIDRCPSLEVTR